MNVSQHIQLRTKNKEENETKQRWNVKTLKTRQW